MRKYQSRGKEWAYVYILLGAGFLLMLYSLRMGIRSSEFRSTVGATVRKREKRSKLSGDFTSMERNDPSLDSLYCPGVTDQQILQSGFFDMLYVRKTKTEIPFWISSHAKEYDNMRHEIFRKGYYYEKWLTHLLQKTFSGEPSADLVLDVGANVGWIALVSASRGMRTVAFEPNPKNVVRLCQSITLNGFKNLIVYNVGISDKNSQLYFHEASRNPGESTVHSRPKSESDIEVAVRTLDSIMDSSGLLKGNKRRVRLLKIDVEGMEDKVLRGADRLLKSKRVDTVLMEFKHSQSQTKRNQEIHRFMQDHEYQVEALHFDTNRSIFLSDAEISASSGSFDRLMFHCLSLVGGHCNLVWTLKCLRRGEC